MKNLTYFSLLTFLSLSCLWCCKTRPANLDNVASITFYRLSIENISGSVPPSQIFADGKSKMYSDHTTIELVNRRFKTNKSHVWKGGFYGELIYENGDSVLIGISRYDAYFVDISNKTQYVFKTDKDVLLWKKLTNNFLTSIK